MTTPPNRPTERGMRITEPAHTSLSQLTFILSAELNRRLSLSEVIAAAVKVATDHKDETVAKLRERAA